MGLTVTLTGEAPFDAEYNTLRVGTFFSHNPRDDGFYTSHYGFRNRLVDEFLQLLLTLT